MSTTIYFRIKVLKYAGHYHLFLSLTLCCMHQHLIYQHFSKTVEHISSIFGDTVPSIIRSMPVLKNARKIILKNDWLHSKIGSRSREPPTLKMHQWAMSIVGGCKHYIHDAHIIKVFFYNYM